MNQWINEKLYLFALLLCKNITYIIHLIQVSQIHSYKTFITHRSEAQLTELFSHEATMKL